MDVSYSGRLGWKDRMTPSSASQVSRFPFVSKAVSGP